MELIEIWEHCLNGFVMVAKLALETISVFCVVLGLLKTIQLTLR